LAFPPFVGPVRHRMHHVTGKHNFAKFFLWLDALAGTGTS